MPESRRERFLREYAEAKLRLVSCWHEQGMMYARAGADGRYDELVREADGLTKRIAGYESVLRNAFLDAPQVGVVGVTVPGSGTGREGWTRVVVGLFKGRVVMRTLMPTMLLPDDFLADVEAEVEVEDADAFDQAVS